jgi:hypothetical protein
MLDKIGTGDIPTVYELPTDAKDGDMCLYAPMNTLTLADSGKRIYFDWEKLREKYIIDDENYPNLYCNVDGQLEKNDDGEESFSFSCDRNNEYLSIYYDIFFASYITSESYNKTWTIYIDYTTGELVDSSYWGEQTDINGEYTEDSVEYTTFEELPTYLQLPNFNIINGDHSENKGYLFHSEYRLMKYQGGEWVEAVKVPTKTSELENDSGFLTEERIPSVHILPENAKDGDLCLYAPANTITIEDSGKRVYFDWENALENGIYSDIAFFGYMKDKIVWHMFTNYGENGTRVFEFINRINNDCITLVLNKDHTFESATIGTVDNQIELENIDQLPKYYDLPNFDVVDSRDIPSSAAILFHTEYKLMVYQGGEWIELTYDLNNTIESLKSQITSIPKFSISVVDVLPTENISETTVYLVKDNETEGNLYTEYVYINNVWEKLGTQTLNLEDYAKTEDVYTKQEIDDKEFITESDLPNNGVYVGSGEMPNNCNLQIDPNGDAIVIPTKTSELENDSGFITNNKIELTTETATLQPNIYYSFGETIALTLEFAEGDPTKLNGYMFGFISGATPTVLTLPSNIKWGNDNEIVIESGKQYEVCVVNNIALWTAAAVEAVS